MSVIKYMSLFTTCSVFIAFFSIVYQAFLSLKQLNKKTTILAGLLALENKSRLEQPKIAVGYGACTDLVINGIAFLNFTDMTDISSENIFDEIKSKSELLESFGYYFKNGVAAERIMPNDELFKNLIHIASTQYKDKIKWTIGGNAPLMALRFFEEGGQVLLGATMSQKLKNLLPDGIQLVGDSVDEDDIHLILEYQSGEEWGVYTAPRANRFILHNDKHNPHLSSINFFDSALKSFNPQLLVVSGIQMMDSYKYEKGVRESRIEKIRYQISSNTAALVHFEMASYIEIAMFNLLLTRILPYTDSIGMNEQELHNLKDVLEVGKIKFASDCNPRVAIALDQMRQVFTALNREYFLKQQIDPFKRRPLSRIHVHTLSYQAILTIKGSKWKNIKNAAAKAALTANRYVCQTDTINPESSSLVFDDSFAITATNITLATRIELDTTNPVSCWDETINIQNNLIQIEICVSPVLVCRTAKKTAGAGDTVSAAGLISQI